MQRRFRVDAHPEPVIITRQEPRARPHPPGYTKRWPVHIEQKDILQADLSEATVVTLYLGHQLNARLLPQLAKLGAGARIMSHDFGLADLPPDKVVQVNSHTDRRTHMIYLWNCPLKTAGQSPQTAP